MDMSILSSVFRSMPSKVCHVSDLILEDQPMKRKGCASCLRLLCCTCGWTEQFYTSAQIDRCFEVNRRFVYATRSIGRGRAAGKRFCGLMNMPPPPRPTLYALHNKALLKAVKKIALETMSDAAKEIHTLKSESDDSSAEVSEKFYSWGLMMLYPTLTLSPKQLLKCLKHLESLLVNFV